MIRVIHYNRVQLFLDESDSKDKVSIKVFDTDYNLIEKLIIDTKHLKELD